MGDDLPGITGPGVAPKEIAEITAAAIEYRTERDRRMAVTPHESAKKQKLIELLHAHEAEIGRDDKGILRYKHGDFEITLRPGKEELKVETIDDNGAEE